MLKIGNKFDYRGNAFEIVGIGSEDYTVRNLKNRETFPSEKGWIDRHIKDKTYKLLDDKWDKLVRNLKDA